MTSDLAGGLNPTRRRLRNDVLVLTKESRTTPAVTITLSLAAGTAADPRGLPGVAHFLSRVLDRGTDTRSGDQIAEFLDGRGVSLNVAAGRHSMTLSCTCLSEDFAPMMELLADIVRHASVPEPEVETRRGELITAIRQDQDNPAMVAIEELLALLYPDEHPYGRRAKGTIESVERMQRRDLVTLRHDRFCPSSLVVVCVGDVEAGHVVDVTERVFGDWTGYPVRPGFVAAPRKVAARQTRVFPMMNKSQVDVAYGFNTISRIDPVYYAASLMNNVLGQYALGGRLGDNIRERQGMAYYAFSAFEPNIGQGPLVVRAGVNPSNVDRTIEAIDGELRKMAAEGLTPAELDASKTYLISSMPRMLETNAGIASFLLNCEHYGLGIDFDRTLPDLLRAVTLEEANDTARRFLDPDRATIAIAGPYERN